MAAFVPANLPSNINTFERLLVYAAMALQSAANGQTVSAVQGEGAQPTCQVQVATIADNTGRFVVSAFVPCGFDELNNPSAKAWMAAQAVTASAPNAVYNTN